MSTNTNRTTTRLEALRQSLRKDPLYRRVVPMEAVIGFPIPERGDDGRVYVTFPLFVRSRGTRGVAQSIVHFPIMASVTIDWCSGRVARWIDYRFRSPFGPIQWDHAIGQIPHASIASLTRGEYIALRTELDELTAAFLDGLQSDTLLSNEVLARYRECLCQLIEPALIPQYQALAPRFSQNFLAS